MKIATNPVMMLSTPSSPPPSMCFGEYQKGLLLRQNHPLSYGLYKLKEALRTVEVYEGEIELLSKKLRHKQPLLGLHTYGDHAAWIKKIPKSLAFEFGWKVLPAIYALQADGACPITLNTQIKYFENRIAKFISKCDEILLIIKQPISNEYARWRGGYSALDDLFVEAKWIINMGINLVP
jgi:hypothetical protein